jgi:alanine-glyoxylate transaminase / serine-glyoxylate transaminase / serine-pyruvate transaminase
MMATERIESSSASNAGATISTANNHPAERILLGPGPSPVPQRVLRALSAPTLGHLDSQYLAITDEVCEMLRHVFRTKNRVTFPLTGTGMAGMECLAVNLIEPGDEVIVSVNGVFSARMKDVMARCGATVHTIDVPWGDTASADQIEAALDAHPKSRIVGLIHAETSTGAHQPIEGIGNLVHRHGALLLVDTVASLGGQDVRLDDWGIDAAYSGSQKCLSCPPGFSPISISERALARIEARTTRVQSWYFDIAMLRNYYFKPAAGPRVYHHTPPINMTYALREALAIIMEEGLDNRLERHARVHQRLRSGIEGMGLSYVPKRSLHTLNCIRVPDGVDDGRTRARLAEEYGIEIGAGLGAMAGKVWRVGLMGHGATVRNVDLFLAALRVAMS